MASLNLAARLLERTWAYRAWQAPFARRKVAPLLARPDLRAARRVLDMGCGPGTNAALFAHADYVGVDYNARYVADAGRRHKGAFIVADVTVPPVTRGAHFDFILLNSLLHHLETTAAERVLAHLGELLTRDGHVHILDLVLPERPSVARLLARWDRGPFARRLDDWYEMFTAAFEPEVFEPYAIAVLGVALWRMVYFKGRVRR